MIDTQKLRAAIAEKKYTAEKLSSHMGIDRATFSRKINGHSDFTVSEACAIAAALSLSPSETADIFLQDLSQKCDK